MIEHFRKTQEYINKKLLKPLPDDILFILCCYFTGILFAWHHINSIYNSFDYWLFIISLICFFVLPLVIVSLFFKKK